MKKMGCVDRLINFYWAHQSQKRNRSEYYWGTLRQTITECWDKTWLMLSCTNDLKYVVHCHCQVQFAEFYWVCYFHSQFFPYSKKYWLLLRTFFSILSLFTELSLSPWIIVCLEDGWGAKRTRRSPSFTEV